MPSIDQSPRSADEGRADHEISALAAARRSALSSEAKADSSSISAFLSDGVDNLLEHTGTKGVWSTGRQVGPGDQIPAKGGRGFE
jgi:hypothetical protein